MRFLIHKNKATPVFYGYPIMIASLIILMLVHGLFISYGVFLTPLNAEFGWSRMALSAAYAQGCFVSGTCAIIFGRICDRYGPRQILTIGGIVLGSGLLFMTRLHSLWQLYFFFGLLISMWPDPNSVLLLSTTARWFVRKRGLVSGVVGIGSGLGIMLIPLLASYLISVYGWRYTYSLLGIIAISCIVPLAQVLQRDPSKKGLRPYGELQVSPGQLEESGFSLHEALRQKQLWMVAIILFLIFYCSDTLLIHITSYAMDSGISSINAASLVSIIGGSSIGGRIIIAGTSDRTGCRRALVITFIIMLASLIWLYRADGLWQLRLFVMAYGFAVGGFSALMSPLLAELFGTRAISSLFGIVIFFGAAGAGMGPMVAGRIYDMTHSYQSAFLVLIIAGIIGLTLALLLRPTQPQD
jgi:MFS family permease